ncbi:MAG: glycosyltransferase family 2 protein [Anaerolineae bacterium]|jgi:GT2 family glycosyltransferase|nr:glycosyltransferase family 2 protein [Anaerolineae bacterium]
MNDLSIIIVSYNSRELTRACLRSAFDGLARSGLRGEVWVVDNASSDGSADMVRAEFPQARLIANAENRGFAAANNQAIAQSDARHILLLNSDAEVRGDALGEMVRVLDARPRVGAVGARLVYPDGSFQHSAFRFPGFAQIFLDFFPLHPRLLDSRLNGRYPRRLYAGTEPFAVDHPLGAALMARGETVRQVGPLDDGFFMYCEEIDWCWRMRKVGWDVLCVPTAEVMHHGGGTTRKFREEMFVALWRSRFRLYEKHRGPRYAAWVRRWVRLLTRVDGARIRRKLARGDIAEGEARALLSAYARVAEL